MRPGARGAPDGDRAPLDEPGGGGDAPGAAIVGPVLRRGRRPLADRDKPQRGPEVSREAWMRLAACTGAAALLQLDGTLITIALPSVAHALGVSSASTAIVL